MHCIRGGLRGRRPTLPAPLEFIRVCTICVPPVPPVPPRHTVVAILAEMAKPRSILAASARPWLTILQGAWWIQTAYIMYK